MSKGAHSVVARIVSSLERRIIEGAFKGGTPLRQAELADEFGTSHIPVREALAALAQRGFVEVVPNRGAVVVALDADQCLELADMRVALELLAVNASVHVATSADHAAAAQALQAGQRSDSLEDRSRHNWQFHRALYAAAKRPFLMRHLETLWRQADRYLQFAWARANYEGRSDAEHAEILAAYEARDSVRAAALTQAHILVAARQVAALIISAHPT